MTRQLAVLGITMLMYTCTSNSREGAIAGYLHEDLGFALDNFPSVIVVITEEGCPSCDRAFADMIRPRTSLPQCLYIVRAEGRTINLTGFIEESEHIRNDDGAFKELGILKGSGIIVLNAGKIDTVVELRSAEIHRQLSYVSALLDSLNVQPISR